MHKYNRIVFLALSSSLLCDPLCSQELSGQSEVLRSQPQPVEAALNSMYPISGYEVFPFAVEPDIADPVAMDFDEDGRLFVAEMRGYSERNDRKLGRIRILEDVDNDGRSDRSVIFADNLNWPTGLMVYDGGLFVADAPDLLYLKDVDGDGYADTREVVFTGFETQNVQGLINSFRWGLDNRIHFSGSRNGGAIHRPGHDVSEGLKNIRRRNVVFDPVSLEMESTSGGGQHGLTFDDWGRKFVTANNDHLQMEVFEERYLTRNPRMKIYQSMQSIASDGPQGDLFPLSPLENWRVVRTQMRIEGTATGLLEGRGRPRGYFSAGTGIVAYRGDAWPAAFKDQLFIGDVGANLISRKALRVDGTQFIADRIDEGFDFLASEDLWFRPTMLRNAPDGNLWFADMYREHIEHPASIPEVLKKRMDLANGDELGRIYVIRPSGATPRPAPKLSQVGTAELVSLLEHANGWHRTTASRLLFEQQDPKAAPMMERLFRKSSSALGRMHCLYALEGQNRLVPTILLQGLNDSDPRVRQHAIRLSESRLSTESSLLRKVAGLVHDEDPLVRLQAALSLGETDDDLRLKPLSELLIRHGSDEHMQIAVFSSLRDDVGPVLESLLDQNSFLGQPYALAILEELIGQLCQLNAREAAILVGNAFPPLYDHRPQLAIALLRGFDDALPAGESITNFFKTIGNAHALEIFSSMIQNSGDRALSESLPLEARSASIEALTLSDFTSGENTFSELLKPTQPQSIRIATIEALNHFDHPGISVLLLGKWAAFSQALRVAAMDVLLNRSERVHSLLDAIESNDFTIGNLTVQDIDRLNFYPDTETRTRARRILLLNKSAPRFKIVERYQKEIDSFSGNTEKGRAIFEMTCLACHQLEGRGNAIGPDLADFSKRGSDALLANILDPNREINPLYENYVISLVDGQSLSGIIVSENDNALVMQTVSGKKQGISRSEIATLTSTGRSLMPEGLEASISPEGMADLIAFLLSLSE